MLVISRKEGEVIQIGEDIQIIISEVGSDKVKIGISAPKDIAILRGELIEISKMNQEASAAHNMNEIKNLSKLLKD